MIRNSNLSYVLQIGKEDEDPPFDTHDGTFDADGNFITYDGPDGTPLYPWEWTMVPEIVALAGSMGVDVPENPEVDLSKTF